MKKSRKILNIIAIFLLVFQVFGYLDNLNGEKETGDVIELIAYYIGFNFPIIVALILFLVSRSLKVKILKKENDDIIDSIGKQEF